MYLQGKVIRIIDLFAGLGGIRLGVSQAAAQLNLQIACILTSEIKKHAILAYQANFGQEEIVGDITQIASSEIPDFDILLGGFPCQPFSSAGLRLGFADTRGTLFFEIARILQEKKPAGFILENVEGLVNHEQGKTLATILQVLDDLDYQVSYAVLDGADFGLAQSRKRIFFVGCRREFNTTISLADFPRHTIPLAHILESNVPSKSTPFTTKLQSHFTPEQLYGKSIRDKRGGSENIHSWDLELKGAISSEQKLILSQLLTERRKKKWAEQIGITWMDGMPLTLDQIASFSTIKDRHHLQTLLDDLVDKEYIKLEHPKELINGKRVPAVHKAQGYNIVTGKLSFEFSKILHPQEVTPTLVATDMAKLGVIDPQSKKIRKLTLREGLRLCGFPESYTLDLPQLTTHQAYDLLGNTVCVPVVTAIAERLLAAIIQTNDKQ